MRSALLGLTNEVLGKNWFRFFACRYVLLLNMSMSVSLTKAGKNVKQVARVLLFAYFFIHVYAHYDEVCAVNSDEELEHCTYWFFSFCLFSSSECSVVIDMHAGEAHVTCDILLYSHSSSMPGDAEPHVVLQGLEGPAKDVIEASVKKKWFFFLRSRPPPNRSRHDSFFSLLFLLFSFPFCFESLAKRNRIRRIICKVRYKLRVDDKHHQI
jgi:hypothetical protein